MYEAFYGLRTKPFSLLPDPEFLYWTSPHSMAFAMLEYGIISRAGFTVVTGEVGAGKTTLIRHLLSKLPEDITVGLVSNTQGDRGDLLSWVMMSLDQEFEGLSYPSLYRRFEEYLRLQLSRGRRTVIIIDEAQNLGTRALEELRMTSNLNVNKSEILQIILVGQPELKTLLSRPELVQFAQRVSSDFHLTCLSRQDVPNYIDHRLGVAGAERILFSSEACALIAATSRGIPRLINTLCDTCLMYGYAKGNETIDSWIVQRAIEDKRRYGIFPMAGPESFLATSHSS